jgi:Delta3-Delta2-enoyl-CoA isomerase
MNFITIHTQDRVAIVELHRGKVSALNGQVVGEISTALRSLETAADVRAVVITGQGKFFSFGFDIPEFLSFSREDFTSFLVQFTSLYTYMFGYPKPLVAALNGHTMAGGCMLALACDHRIMVTGNAKIALNEIGFGSSVFAGSTEMLRFAVGSANASRILLTGTLYTAEQAREVGLVDEVASEETVLAVAKKTAAELGAKSSPAFARIKRLLRGPVLEQMRPREAESIREFVEIWYSEVTWKNLKMIVIR